MSLQGAAQLSFCPRLPSDSSQEQVPECHCTPHCPPPSPDDSGWCCPSRFSIAMLEWGTGRALKFSLLHTATIEWFVLFINFEYLYVRLSDKVCAIKRPQKEHTEMPPFLAKVWLLPDCHEPEDIVRQIPEGIHAIECAKIEILLDPEGAYCGTFNGAPVPSPIVRHCMGKFPLRGKMSMRSKFKYKGLERPHQPLARNALVVHYPKNCSPVRYYSPEPTFPGSFTAMEGCLRHVSRDDPYEPSGSEDDEALVRHTFTSTATGPQTQQQELEFTRIFSGCSKNKVARWFDVLPNDRLPSLHQWLCAKWVLVTPDGPAIARCLVCPVTFNNVSVPNGRPSPVVDHCVGKKHIEGLKRIGFERTREELETRLSEFPSLSLAGQRPASITTSTTSGQSRRYVAGHTVRSISH